MHSPIEQAKAFIRTNQPLLAVELLVPWLEAHPEDASAWSALAGARYELGNYGAALTAAEQAVKLKPESARNWCNFGMMLRKTGNLYDAERALHRALTLDSTYDRARTELRKVSEIRSGDRKPESQFESD